MDVTVTLTIKEWDFISETLRKNFFLEPEPDRMELNRIAIKIKDQASPQLKKKMTTSLKPRRIK